MGDTKTDLVNDLLAKPEGQIRDYIVKQARKGYYHDFETPLATPKMVLREDLLEAGFKDLAQKVVDGEYDDERMPRQHGPRPPPPPPPKNTAVQKALATFERSIRQSGFSEVATRALLYVVLEECAVIADTQAKSGGFGVGDRIAADIRALKDRT